MFLRWLLLLIQEGFNKRLGTNNLSIIDTYMAAGKRGFYPIDVAVMPEQDDWIFQNDEGVPDGPSMVCDVLVMRVCMQRT